MTRILIIRRDIMQKRAPVLILLILLLLTGCAAEKAEPTTRTVFAMDTVMNLTVYSTKGGEQAMGAAVQEIYRLEALLARGVESSEVYALNHGGTPGEELSALLAVADEIAAATDGAFDPCLGGVLDLWGFGSGAGEQRVPSDAELADAPQLLDLGGIAKGYAGQRVCEVLRDNGVSGAVLDLGGDVAL
ncbi:MAG: hypothetical protein E7425_13860, partial [Ruminococcaceae bacterium]|nr:hypothetical protein [Oscillospiraceae bacterium]